MPHRIKQEVVIVNIVNLIHIGDQVYNFDDLDSEKKKEVADKLNEQVFEGLGCKIKTA